MHRFVTKVRVLNKPKLTSLIKTLIVFTRTPRYSYGDCGEIVYLSYFGRKQPLWISGNQLINFPALCSVFIGNQYRENSQIQIIADAIEGSMKKRKNRPYLA